MTDAQGRMWQKISDFSFDSAGTTHRFRDRLAKENGWSTRRCDRAIEEYRRFLLLAATCGHPVSPPDQIDQVWHLHLLYTRSYWDQMCRQTLGLELHHEPTKGGPEETRKFADWYARTLQSYRAAFGSDAPTDVWPVAETHKPRFRRVDLASNWVLPRTRLAPAMLLLIALLVIVAMAGGWAPAPQIPVASVLAVDNPLDLRGGDFLSLYVFAMALSVGLAVVLLLQSRRSPDSADPNTPLGPYEIALLREGPSLAVRAAVANLVSQGALTLAPTGTCERTSAAYHARHPLEEAILFAATRPLSMRSIDLVARPAITQMETQLEEAGLLIAPGQRKLAAIGLAGIGVVAAGGIVKVMVGMSRGKPVGYLVALVVILGIAAWVIARARPRRTRAGSEAVRSMLERHRPDQPQTPQPTPAGGMAMPMYGFDPMTMMVALYGMQMLQGHPTLGPLRPTLEPSNTAGGDTGSSDGSIDSGGSSDSSDSGGGDSGCSSGCGGCGGGGD